jgi:hypothetical protein
MGEREMIGRVIGCALALMAGGVAALGAQGRPIQVQGRTDLDFGVIVAGVPTQVPPIPGGGMFRVRGRRGAEVQLQLTLPPSLDGPGGSAPLTFGATDGAHGPDPTPASAQIFDPRLPLTFVVPNGQVYYVWIGGTVSPPLTLTTGTYSSTIVLTATYTGN